VRFIILLAIGTEAVSQRRCCRVRPRVAGARSLYSSRVMDMVVSLASRERGPALTHRRSLCAPMALAPITSPALRLADGL
jgi:hypothetical protein